MGNEKSKISLYLNDILRCFKLSLMLWLIPLILGGVTSFIGQLIKGQGIITYNILLTIRNLGFIIPSFGLFIGAVGYLMPLTHLRPLDYNEDWRRFFSKLNMVTVITITCAFMVFYTFILDIIMFAIYVK